MVVFPRQLDERDDEAPGPWYRPCVGWPDGKKRATLRMPCGHHGTVGEGHEVLADGTITPSVVCPWKPCAFHEHVKLEGWTP
jgi:hypothetical protein